MRLPGQNRRFLKRISLLNFCFRKPKFSEGIPCGGKGKEMVSFREKESAKGFSTVKKNRKKLQMEEKPTMTKKKEVCFKKQNGNITTSSQFSGK